MTTPNIEWLIGHLRSFSGTSLAPALMHQAADTLQSQAERIKELIDSVNFKHSKITELENERDSLRAELDDATAAARTEQMIAETAQAAASRLLTERDELRAQIAALEADCAETRDELQEVNDSLASTYHILGERDAQLAEIEKAEPVIWAISYDGVTPYTLWHEGDGPLLDCEVKRQGGTTQKMPLYTRPMPATIDAGEPVAIALNTGTKQGVKWLRNIPHGEKLFTRPMPVQDA